MQKHKSYFWYEMPSSVWFIQHSIILIYIALCMKLLKRSHKCVTVHWFLIQSSKILSIFFDHFRSRLVNCDEPLIVLTQRRSVDGKLCSVVRRRVFGGNWTVVIPDSVAGRRGIVLIFLLVVAYESNKCDVIRVFLFDIYVDKRGASIAPHILLRVYNGANGIEARALPSPWFRLSALPWRRAALKPAVIFFIVAFFSLLISVTIP